MSVDLVIKGTTLITTRVTVGGLPPPPPATGPEGIVFQASFDGSDGATSFTEESVNAAVATFIGSTEIDTAQFKFGVSSLRVAGDGASLTFPGIAAYDMSDQDWTVEFFVRFNSLDLADTLWAQDDAGSAIQPFHIVANSVSNYATFTIGIEGGGSAEVGSLGTWNRSTNVWYHIAACRNGSDMRIFIDGIQQGPTVGIGTPTFESSTTHVMRIGHGTGNSTLFHTDGWFDEMRMIIGTGLYTSNFTPPTEAFLPPP